MFRLLVLFAVLYSTCSDARSTGQLQVAKCEVSIKDAGVTMPTFYIPANDIPIFRDVVSRAEVELRREAAAALSQVKTEDARRAVKELMDLEFYMKCETGSIDDYGIVKCQMCNYHESPTALHLVQGTVVDSDLESCMAGIFENRPQPGPNFHPTCFPELPATYNQGSTPKRSGKKSEKPRPILKINRNEDNLLADRSAYEAEEFAPQGYVSSSSYPSEVSGLNPRSFASDINQHSPYKRLYY